MSTLEPEKKPEPRKEPATPEPLTKSPHPQLPPQRKPGFGGSGGFFNAHRDSLSDPSDGYINPNDLWFAILTMEDYWNSENLTKEDFIYRNIGEKSWARIKDGTEIHMTKYWLLNITGFPDEKIEALFRATRAAYGTVKYKSEKYNGNEICEFLERKGPVYQFFKEKGILHLADAYLKSGSEADFSKLVAAAKTQPKITAGAPEPRPIASPDAIFHEVDIVGAELFKQLSDFGGVREFCREIYAKASRKIIGQEKPLKDIILKLATYIISPESQEYPVLVTGSTGSGKTYAVRTVSDIIGLPFSEISTPQLTPAGYKGTNIADKLSEAVGKTVAEHNGYPNRMVIYLDEFGKILMRGSSTQFSMEIQNEFLKLLEPGATLRQPTQFGVIEMPFKAMVVMSDAFSFINTKGEEISRKDLMEAGFAPELAGRIQLVAPLRTLTAPDFERIMLAGEDTVLQTQRKLCNGMGLEVTLTAGAVKQIAKLAEQDGAGGRSLNHLINTIFEREMNERIYSDRAKVSAMIAINRKTVEKHIPHNGTVRGGFGFRAQG